MSKKIKFKVAMKDGEQEIEGYECELAIWPGIKFVVHRPVPVGDSTDEHTRKMWRVTHFASGMAVGRAAKTKDGAIANALERFQLPHMCEDYNPKNIERARKQLEECVVINKESKGGC